MIINLSFQTVKEPLLRNSIAEVLFKSSNTHRDKKWMVSGFPLPHCQFLQIHGSIFKPYPHTDSFQPLVRCITYSIFFLCIVKDPLDCLGSETITFFSLQWMSDILCLFYIIFPDIAGYCLLTVPALCTQMSCPACFTLVTQTLIFPVPLRLVVLYDMLLYSGQITISRYSSYTYWYHSWNPFFVIGHL